jgi:hypothetical protein
MRRSVASDNRRKRRLATYMKKGGFQLAWTWTWAFTTCGLRDELSPRLPSTAPQYDLRLRRQPRLCRSPRGFAGVAGKRAPFIAPWHAWVAWADPIWKTRGAPGPRVIGWGGRYGPARRSRTPS